MNTYEIFDSKIIPYLPDECQVNPNVYGFEFADWLSRKLAQNKLIFSYPGQEDWGWYIEQSDGEREIWVCISGEIENGNITYRFFVEEQKGFFAKKKFSVSEVENLERVIVKIIEDEGMKVSINND